MIFTNAGGEPAQFTCLLFSSPPLSIVTSLHSDTGQMGATSWVYLSPYREDTSTLILHSQHCRPSRQGGGGGAEHPHGPSADDYLQKSRNP